LKISRPQGQHSWRIEQFYERWLLRYHGPNTRRGDKTLKHNEDAMRAFIKDYGHRRLDDYGRNDARDYAAEFPWRARVVSAFFADAVRDGKLDAPPFAGMSIKRGKGRQHIDPLTMQEVERLASDRREPARLVRPALRAFIRVAGWTGMRPGELCRLEWRDILWSQNEIDIRRTKTESDRCIALATNVAWSSSGCRACSIRCSTRRTTSRWARAPTATRGGRCARSSRTRCRGTTGWRLAFAVTRRSTSLLRDAARLRELIWLRWGLSAWDISEHLGNSARVCEQTSTCIRTSRPFEIECARPSTPRMWTPPSLERLERHRAWVTADECSRFSTFGPAGGAGSRLLPAHANPVVCRRFFRYPSEGEPQGAAERCRFCTGGAVSEWREIVEWDWALLGRFGVQLHAVRSLDDDIATEEQWGGDGTTECGKHGHLSIPGLFDRMGAQRCVRCCVVTGMPFGKQSPKNVEECRPVVEARLTALGEKGQLFCCAGGAAKGYELAGLRGRRHRHRAAAQLPLRVHPGRRARVPARRLRCRARQSALPALHALPAHRQRRRVPGPDRADTRAPEGVRPALRDRERDRRPAHAPTLICGSMFDPPMDIQRHRLFETNWPLGSGVAVPAQALGS
jgi:integrase